MRRPRDRSLPRPVTILVLDRGRPMAQGTHAELSPATASTPASTMSSSARRRQRRAPWPKEPTSFCPLSLGNGSGL